MPNQLPAQTPDQNLSLFEFSKKLYALYRPYFGLEGEKAWHSIALAGMVIGQVAAAIIMAMINSAFTVFTGLLLQPVITYALLFQSCATIGLLMGTYGLLAASTTWLAQTLGLSLAKSINETITRQWMQTGAYYGIPTLNPLEPPIDPAGILSKDVPNLSTQIIEFTNLGLMTIGNFVVGMTGLFTLSNTLTFTVASLTVTIPGYMVFATLAYAFGYNYLTQTVGASLKAQEVQLRAQQDQANQHILYMNVHREEIAFKNGAQTEETSILNSLYQSYIVQKTMKALTATLMLLNICQQQFSMIVALIIASPNIVARKIPFESIFSLTGYFSLSLGLFTFKGDNFEKLKTSEVELKRIEELQHKIKAWELAHQAQQERLKIITNPIAANPIAANPVAANPIAANPIAANPIAANPVAANPIAANPAAANTIHPSSADIIIHELTAKTADNQVILNAYNTRFQKGKINHLRGPSGAGKTTVLRAMAGLTPFAQGRIEGLPANTVYIPERPYFPFQQSLLAALIYPHTTATPTDRTFIHTLMDELHLPHLKPRLDEISDWNRLSGGEKQRCMIITAILKKPDCLVMDEATARVDHLDGSNTKARIEACLKRHLPGKTIIYTDHNPSQDFHDHVIDIQQNANLQQIANIQPIATAIDSPAAPRRSSRIATRNR